MGETDMQTYPENISKEVRYSDGNEHNVWIVPAAFNALQNITYPVLEKGRNLRGGVVANSSAADKAFVRNAFPETFSPKAGR